MDRLGDWVVLYYRNISNLEEVLADAKTLATSAVIDASLLCSKLHIAAAIQRLSNNLGISSTGGGPSSSSIGHLRSKNMLSELVLMVSPTKNISEALRIFSCAEGCTSAVFALYTPQREDIAHVVSLVKGDLSPLAELPSGVDVARIAAVYNIPPTEVAFNGGCVEPSVVNRIATCDI